jgi:hypothetical protein
MSSVIQKALAGAEDLLLGAGTATQTRNGASATITKINADELPYSGDGLTVRTIKEEMDTPLRDDTTAGITRKVALRHTKSNDSFATGVGAGIALEQETAAANIETIGAVDAVTSDLTDGAEESYLSFKSIVAGALTEILKWTKDGGYLDKLYEKTASAGITAMHKVIASAGVYVDNLYEKTGSAGITANHVIIANAGVQTDTISQKTNNANIAIKPDGSKGLIVADDGKIYGTDIHFAGHTGNSLDSTTNRYICSGTYTPTLTAGSNYSSGSVYTGWRFIRVGNVVEVAGAVNITPSAGSVIVTFGISLPIASDLANTYDLSGEVGTVFQAGTYRAHMGLISADTGNNRASASIEFINGSANDIAIRFSYIVL